MLERRVEYILLNLVPASSSVWRCVHDEMNGAAVSSTDVLFIFRCMICVPSSTPSECARPSRSADRREVIPARLRYCLGDER